MTETNRDYLSKKLTIIVPVYNSGSTISSLANQLRECFINFPIEIILVNDCSLDNSWQEIHRLSIQNDWVKGINLTKNYGQHAATLCGIAYATGEWIATIDDDFEQSPVSLKDIYQYALNSSSDVVYGIRSVTSHSFLRQQFSSLGRFMLRNLIRDFSTDVSSVRLIRAEIAKLILDFHAPFPFVDGYLSWVTCKVDHFTIPNYSRQVGKSGYTFRKLFRVTGNIFLGFSDQLLKLVVAIGLFMSLFGIGSVIAIILLRVFSIITLPGYSSIIASIFFFSGLQLFILGILGLYISRLTFITSNKPQYKVREVLNLCPMHG